MDYDQSFFGSIRTATFPYSEILYMKNSLIAKKFQLAHFGM